jgi:bacterioferritin-associated ferredoxin
MYVCVCKAVTDSQIHQSIEGGAQSREEVTRACGAGGDCGACHGMIEDMIEERLVSPEALVRGRAA